MEYILVTKENLEKEHICCAISNNKDIQVSSKKSWLADRFDEGLVFLKSAERGKCFIEYIPAENAWNPIEADGYMYIDCLWVSGSFKGHGYSNDLLSACIEDSRKKGKQGLCILSSAKKKPFLADPKYLKHKGFTVCDEADNGIQLWICLSSKSAQNILILMKQVMYCSIPSSARLMQNTYRLWNTRQRKTAYLSRRSILKVRNRLRTLLHRLRHMRYSVTENT